jgi:hypothetical protein
MNQHRENLQKLIKIIEVIKLKGHIGNTLLYFDNETIVSLRELTRMFIDELDSEHLECKKDDEIILFIEDTINKLKITYDNIIKEELTNSENIKLFKICGQLIKDYGKIYSESKGTVCLKDDETDEFKCMDGFNFGKRNKPIKDIYTSNSFQQPITINLTVNGENVDAEKLVSELVKKVKERNKYI